MGEIQSQIATLKKRLVKRRLDAERVQRSVLRIEGQLRELELVRENPELAERSDMTRKKNSQVPQSREELFGKAWAGSEKSKGKTKEKKQKVEKIETPTLEIIPENPQEKPRTFKEKLGETLFGEGGDE